MIPRRRHATAPAEALGTERYVRRDDKGQFKEQIDVGRFLAPDRRQKAKHDAGPGQGDRR